MLALKDSIQSILSIILIELEFSLQTHYSYVMTIYKDKFIGGLIHAY